MAEDAVRGRKTAAYRPYNPEPTGQAQCSQLGDVAPAGRRCTYSSRLGRLLFCKEGLKTGLRPS